MWKGVVLAALAWTAGGCVTGTDPVTGEKTFGVDPNSKIVQGAEVAAEGLAAVGPLFGATGGLIAGAAAGILAAWRKIKPSLTQARTKAAQYYAATAATVTAIEEFKEASPDSWARLGALITEQLTKQGLDPKTIENVIRAIRGLPAKA